MHSRLPRLAGPFARAMMAVVVAGSTSGCATMITGIVCAAGGGCQQGAIAQAAELDVRVGGAILEGVSRSSGPALSSSGGEVASAAPASMGRASLEGPEAFRDDARAELDVHVDFDDDERHSVSVFQETPDAVGHRRKRIAACETPCRLTLAPDVYGISVDASVVQPLTIGALTAGGPSAGIQFSFHSHEPRRIQGWTMVGSAVGAFGLLAVTSLPMTETFDDTITAAHLLGTSLGLFSLLVAGVVLAIWPDDLDAQVSW